MAESQLILTGFDAIARSFPRDSLARNPLISGKEKAGESHVRVQSVS
jgi:hypothetical protein